MDRYLLGFKKKIETCGKRQGWLDSSSMLVAVSGGGDSVALLWLLREFYGGKILVAHLDHCTRNGASHDDADFVRGLCRKWNIPCFVKRVEVKENAERGESFEMAARRLRYTFFEEMAKQNNIDFIAVGHNLDDVVETQLLNLFRGAGIEGLRGVPETRGKIVRPLVDFRRLELRELLRREEIEWREDESNSENLYNRNKIRNILIPWVKENLNRNFEISMAGLAREASHYAEQKLEETRKLLAEITIETEFPAAWEAKKVRAFSELQVADLLRLQGKMLELPVLDRRRTEQLAQLIKKGGRWRFQWTGDVEVCRADGKIVWLHRNGAQKLVHRNCGNG